MWQTLIKNWRIYLIEAWALGMFMVSAAFFTILLEHPNLLFKTLLPLPLYRRFLAGIAMGITAIFLIYSKWGKRSGAHMNPAVTLTFLQLDRIRFNDAAWYIIAQFIGGTFGILIFKWTTFSYISDPAVNYAVTIPGMDGPGVALFMEIVLSFVLFSIVLFSSNSTKWASYTGYLVGLLLVIFITFEAPFSGMSINPARTVASAFPANVWTDWWLYFIGPILGMNAAGYMYRRWYRKTHDGNCLTMKCHMSGEKHNSPTYDVLGPKDLLEKYRLGEQETLRIGEHSNFKLKQIS
ncbi:MAG: aquaporin [Saprospiraceae bacterium]|nr:aquaporin [Saprospiraceae bacterium]